MRDRPTNELADELERLAARCEAAAGAEYALDCAVWDSVYPGERQKRFDALTAPGAPYGTRLTAADLDGYIQPLRSFTASLDAALTLVPDGMGWTAGWGQTRPDEPMGGAVVGNNARFVGHGANYDAVAFGESATPALALCAAALRARAALAKAHTTEESHGE